MRISDWSSDVCSSDLERRKPLLKAGVRLFEMRGPDRADGKRPRRSLLSTGSGSGGGSDGPVLRSSASMLHAKTFAVEGQRLFVGSFNFDPRSMHLTTDLGFGHESPTLAANSSDPKTRVEGQRVERR